MSSIVRLELESYIENQKKSILKALRDAKADAIRTRNHDMLHDIESFEAEVQVFKPTKADFVAPTEYIEALRSYALALSIVDSIIKYVGLNSEALNVAKTIMSLARQGLPVGKIAEDARKFLSELEKGGRVYRESLVEYINVLVGKIKEPESQELLIAREAIETIITNDRPVWRLTDLAKVLGTKDKDLLKFLDKLASQDSNFIVSKSYVFFKDKLKQYVSDVLSKRGYIRVDDQAKEWNLKPKEILKVFGEIKDIFPDMKVYGGLIITTNRAMSNVLFRLLSNRPIWSLSELAATLNVKEKILRDILSDTIQYIPNLLRIDLKIFADRNKILEWFKSLFGDRESIFIDELASRLGVDIKTAQQLASEVMRVSSNIVVLRGKKLYYAPNIEKKIAEGIKTGKPIPAIDKEVHDVAEKAVFKRISDILNDFSRLVGD